MLNIQLSKKHLITSNSHGFILNQRGVCKKTGKEKYCHIGYYSNLESLLKGYIDLEIKSCNATSLEEVVDNIKKLKKSLENQFNTEL